MRDDVVNFIFGLWHNAPLMAALAGIVVAQLLKVPIEYLIHRRWDLHKIVDAGGMPSAHAAGVCALTFSLAYVVGPASPLFATAVVFTAIVLYDAGGIRRHAGEHAVLLNRLAMEMAQSGVSFENSSTAEGERLKEILGHEPPEIAVGAILGIIIGAIFGKWWF
jgi:uncharacterized protein